MESERDKRDAGGGVPDAGGDAGDGSGVSGAGAPEGAEGEAEIGDESDAGFLLLNVVNIPPHPSACIPGFNDANEPGTVYGWMLKEELTLPRGTMISVVSSPSEMTLLVTDVRPGTEDAHLRAGERITKLHEALEMLTAGKLAPQKNHGPN